MSDVKEEKPADESEEAPKETSETTTETAATDVKKEDDAAKQPVVKKEGDDKSAMSEDEILSNLMERLKFFFSDANVRQDPFIRNLLLSPDTSVGISQLLKFNTIKQYSTDSNMIKKAAEKLPDILTVKDDAIGRVNEFTKDLMDKNLPVSLLVGNLPYKKEEDGRSRYSVTVDDLKAMFEGYGPLALIKLRFGFVQSPDDDLLGSPRGKKRPKGPRLPLGSALVEFETVESLEKAAEETLTVKDGETIEPKRKLTFGESELTVIKLQEHVEKSKKKRKAEEAEHGEGEEEDEELPTFSVDWKPGCVIKMEGLSESCDREQILEAVAKGLDKDAEGVKEMKVYVDYSRGQTEGCIRFLTPDPVPDILKKLQSGDLEVAGAKVEKAFTLEGDEEKQYWQDFMEFKTKQLRQRNDERRRGGGGRHHHHRKKFRRH